MNRLTKLLRLPRSTRRCRMHRSALSVTALENRSVPSGTDIFAVGANAGGAPRVQIFDTAGVKVADFLAYDSAFRGGVRVAVADVTGDGLDDVITAPGQGGGPHVKVFRGVGSGGVVSNIDSLSPVASFMAYDPAFRGGIYVAGGDLNGDGFDDVVTGAGEGGGPHVRAFAARHSGSTYGGIDDHSQLASFQAYDDRFRGGVRVAARRGELVTAPGIGGGPHVKVFDTLTANGQFQAVNPNAPASQFFAYDSAFRGGVYVAFGDLNHDGADDVITGPGEGGGPHVKSFRNRGTDDAPSFAGDDLVASFLAGPAAFRGGVRVGSVRIGNDDRLVTGIGRHHINGDDGANHDIGDDHGGHGNDDAFDLDDDNDGRADRGQFETFEIRGNGVIEDDNLSGNLDDRFRGGVFVGV